jgi:hypothetical protein
MRLAIKAFIRIFLIYVALQTILYIINYVHSMLIYSQVYHEDLDLFLPVIVLVAAVLIVILVIYILWWKTDWLVRVLTGRTREKELVISTSNLDLIKVAMRILGIVLLVNAIPTLIGLISYYFIRPEDVYYSRPEAREYIIVGVKIVFGIWLIIGSRGIVKAINKVWDKAHLINDEQGKE